MKIKNKVKKIITIITLTAFLLVQSGTAWAIDFPSAPTPPSQPAAPTQPPAPTEPPAPTAPPAPSQPTPKPTVVAQEPTPIPTSKPDSVTPIPGTSQAQSTTQSTADETTQEAPAKDLQGQKSDGNVGDTTISTGDATNTGSSVVLGNTNLSANGAQTGTGILIANSNNANDSTNTASGNIIDNTTTVQDNLADVHNGLDLNTITGQNSASSNVGNVNVETGDANTTGTMITSVNTNISGVAVSEFNIVDDHVGDVVLDFSNPANCVAGCGNGSTTVQNTGNTGNSDNNATLTQEANNSTFQNNDATVENTMTLNSDTGNNEANKNTMGNTSIDTGDANVSASILTFANNNIAGNVIVGVVNIFGNLIGDIILPDFSSVPCSNCSQDTKVANTGNSNGSTNTASLETNSNDSTFQTNDATLENNIVVSATTGDNSASRNTMGDKTVETGDASVDVNTLNVVNSNVEGGDFWVVLVNDAGNWLGKILGSPDGANYAGSGGTDFKVDQNGNVTVSNNGNTGNSENNASVTQNSNTTTTQNNTANVVNNVNLNANTGGNTADKNVGDTSILTGDAKVVANVVNFLNNNFSSKGKAVIVLINPFKKWVGDVIPFGYKKPKKEETPPIGSAGNLPKDPEPTTAQEDKKEDKKENQSQQQQTNNNSQVASQPARDTQNTVQNKTAGVSIHVSYKKASDDNKDTLVAGIDTKDTSKELQDKAKVNSMRINLAWFLLIVPLTLAYVLIRRRLLIIRSLKSILF